MTAPSSVEAYLADLPAASLTFIEELRATILATAPDATEVISYQIPTLKQGGRMLVSYAAFARHCSVFPASQAVREALGEELDPYLAGKATIRFALDRPIPRDLVRRVVEIRLAEVASGGR
jgi:uncharacterized protein YdhG (YjbR/CyaY superfamily)